MNAFVDMFALPFARMALGGSLLVALMCSYLGVWVVLRRVVFVGIALGQLAALGVALSFYLPVPAAALALLTSFGGALLLSAPIGGRWVPRETRIGFAYATAAAGATLLVAKSAQGEAHVLSLLFGNVLLLEAADLLLLAGAALLVGLIHFAFRRPFLFVSFDPETARTAGFSVGRWNAVFDLTLALAIAAGLYAAGALLVFSYLVQPAMIGLRVGRNLREALLVAMASGALVTLVGVALSLAWDLPTGPTVICANSALLIGVLSIVRARD